jgi:hypothetical protein
LNAADIHLIYRCRVLDDSTSIKDLHIPPADSIVIHVTAHRSTPPDLPPYPEADPRAIFESYTPPEIHAGQRPAPAGPRDPADFEDLISSIEEMGFTRGQAERSLRATRYRMEVAIDRLLSGDFPDESPESPVIHAPPPPVQRRADFGEFQQFYDELSEHDQTAVLRLVAELEVDAIVVLQIFIACDNQEDAAREALRSG